MKMKALAPVLARDRGGRGVAQWRNEIGNLQHPSALGFSIYFH